MHNGSVRATALVLGALAEVEPRHPLIEETTRWLVVARAANWWKTSVGRAQAMASLGSFAALTGETRGVYDYRVLLNTRQILAGDFNVPAHDYYDGTAIALEELPLGEVSRVRFEREAGPPGAHVLRPQSPLRHARSRCRGPQPRLRRLPPLLAA